MRKVATIIGREIGKPVEYRFVDRSRPEIKAEYLEKFGTQEHWLDDSRTTDALNNGVVGFHGGEDTRPRLPTTTVSELS